MNTSVPYSSRNYIYKLLKRTGTMRTKSERFNNRHYNIHELRYIRRLKLRTINRNNPNTQQVTSQFLNAFTPSKLSNLTPLVIFNNVLVSQ